MSVCMQVIITAEVEMLTKFYVSILGTSVRCTRMHVLAGGRV